MSDGLNRDHGAGRAQPARIPRRKRVWAAPALWLLLLPVVAQAQVELAKQINPSGSAGIGWLTEYDGKLYFEADDGVNGDEIWRYDANTNIAQRLTDINPDGDSGIAWLVAFDGYLYFEADDGVNGDQLWRYNSSTNMAELVYDGQADELTVYQDKLYFSGTDSTNGRELWSYDPDTDTAAMVANIRPGSESSSPNGFVVYNDALYFSADDGDDDSTFNSEPWRYDANTDTAERVQDIGPGGNSLPRGFTVYAGKLYFAASGQFGERELWRYDSVTDLAVKVTDINSGPGASSSPAWLAVYEGKLYFQARGAPPLSSQRGYELWSFDASDDSWELVEDINPGEPDSTPTRLHVYNGSLYFFAETVADGVELWRYTAATDTAEQVADINPTGNSQSVSTLGLRSSPGYANYAGQMYFDADDGTNGKELWRLGTEAPSDVVFADGFEN